MLHSRHIFNAMNYMQLNGKFVPLGEKRTKKVSIYIYIKKNDKTNGKP